MRKSNLIKLTKNILENISTIKEEMKKLVPGERPSEKVIYLKKILKALELVPRDSQRLIAYRYFENKTHEAIANILGVNKMTVKRRLDKLILEIGRLAFGFEDEFFIMIGTVEFHEYKSDREIIIDLLG